MPVDFSPNILIIDDESAICRNCVKILSGHGQTVEYALNGADGLKLLSEKPYHIVITDLKMSRMGGMEVLKQVRSRYPDITVIVITGFASVSSAVEAMKMGAYDYLPKPFTPHELRAVVSQAVNHHKIRRHHQDASSMPAKPVLTHQLIGASPQILNVVAMIRKAAPTDTTVLISGESGTGKELVARALHANSLRKDHIFFAVDCGTLTDNLLESELFGYVKGAFTNAHRDKDGIFQIAHRGTIFLDEISNISIEVQGKLLRFLDSMEFLPVGGTAYRKVDLRLIFATNKDLKQMVREGTFRNDFYYRINVYPIAIPPLRERETDIMPIAANFLGQFNRAMGKAIAGFDEAAIASLMRYDWPGNIRQLRNIVERAVILCEKGIITRDDLPHLSRKDDLEKFLEQIPATSEELKTAKKEARRLSIQEVEAAFVRHSLEKSGGNISRAAKATGMQRSNFQNLMKKYRIKAPEI